MLNKGFIKTFAIILGLICLYYLSFTVVSNHYENKAEEYAAGDLNRRQRCGAGICRRLRRLEKGAAGGGGKSGARGKSPGGKAAHRA